MVDIKQLELLYFQSCKPVQYNLKCGKQILINPILVEDWGIFENCLDILRVEKNEINDISVIQMTYLEFLIKMMESDDTVTSKLLYLFKYSLGVDKISIENSNGDKVIAILDDDNFIKAYITSKEFNDIKKIILYQNIYDYNDRYIDPELRRAISVYNRTKYKNQVSPTLEMQKVFVISKTGMSMDKINKMTYRTFSQVYKFNIKEDLYMSKNIIKASTKYDVKEEIIHPMFEKEHDIFDEIFVDAEGFTQKIQSSNG